MQGRKSAEFFRAQVSVMPSQLMVSQLEAPLIFFLVILDFDR